MSAKGRFIPKFPQKYLGNPNQIFFRSSWELNVMKLFDKHSSVTRWNSEEFGIPYISPKDGKRHIYYPDFFAKMLIANGREESWVIEVKPLKESKMEHANTVYDRMALAINEAKWAAAHNFCNANGLKFIVITELDIFRMMPETRKRKTTKSAKKSISTKKTISTRGTQNGTRKTKAST